jgi:hypothetical protein
MAKHADSNLFNADSNPFNLNSPLMQSYAKEYDRAVAVGVLSIWEEEQEDLVSKFKHHPEEAKIMEVLKAASAAELAKARLPKFVRLLSRAHAVLTREIFVAYYMRFDIDPQPWIVEDQGEAAHKLSLLAYEKWKNPTEGLAEAFCWARDLACAHEQPPVNMASPQPLKVSLPSAASLAQQSKP